MVGIGASERVLAGLHIDPKQRLTGASGGLLVDLGFQPVSIGAISNGMLPAALLVWIAGDGSSPSRSDGAIAERIAGGAPRLVLVEEGREPAVAADCCHDWMSRTGKEVELRSRIRQLSLRSLAHGRDQPRLDAHGLLHVGLRSVALSPKEQAVAAVLLEHFDSTVSAEQVVDAARPDGIKSPTVLATRISALRSRVAWVGLEIWGSSAKGYLLLAASAATDSNGGGFEAELRRDGWLPRRRAIRDRRGQGGHQWRH